MPARTAQLLQLPGITTTDETDTIINWGLGADSSAYLAKMLTDPTAHGINLDRTVVLYMATGSEWPETRFLVEEFIPWEPRARSAPGAPPARPAGCGTARTMSGAQVAGVAGLGRANGRGREPCAG